MVERAFALPNPQKQQKKQRKSNPKQWQKVVDLHKTDPLKSFEIFCKEFIVIVGKAGKRLPFKWNRAQRRVMEKRAGRDIVLKGRQLGMTTLELARSLWLAALRPNISIAVITPSEKDDKLKKAIRQKLEIMLEGLPESLGASWSDTRLQFGNGSTITVFDAGGSVDAATKAGRGGTYHRVHFTEVAFYHHPDELFLALSPAIPSVSQGGEIMIESTANGSEGLFAKYWNDAVEGTNGYTPHFAGWYLSDEESERIGNDRTPARPETEQEHGQCDAAKEYGEVIEQAQLLWWRQQVQLSGYDKTRQEHPHEPSAAFLNPGTCYFDLFALERVRKEDIKPPLPLQNLVQMAGIPGTAQPFMQRFAQFHAQVNKGNGNVFRAWDGPRAGSNYLIAVDTASGKKSGDWLVAPVFETRSKRHIATLRAKVQTPEFARWVALLGRALNSCPIVVERNNHGHSVLLSLVETHHYTNLWRPNPQKNDLSDLGFYTSPGNRQAIIDDLVDAVTRKEFVTHDQIFLQEAHTFERTASGKVEARPGADNHDDLIMACAIGWHVMTHAYGRSVEPFSTAKNPNSFT